jgi:hypothetical protein
MVCKRLPKDGRQRVNRKALGASSRSPRVSPLRVAALAELPKLPLVENRQGRPQARICGSCARRALSITGTALLITVMS